MVTNICLLLEALSVIFCLNCLYGEKFKLDIETTSFLAIDMIFMTAINYYELPKIYTMIIYPAIALYCGIKFGFKLGEIIINVILCIIMVGAIQMIVTLPSYFLLDIQIFSEYKLLFINCIAFIIVLCLIPRLRINNVVAYLRNRERTLIISISICLLIAAFCIIAYKQLIQVELSQTILLFTCVVFILGLTGQLNQYKIKSKEIETELKVHKLYSDSFQSLIDTIRLKQHEFDNHISTIYSQHYMYDTYEALVNEQMNYCEQIMKENRFNKLLTKGNPVIISFLYGKLIEIDKKGINVTYKVSVEDLDIGIPIHKIVEILGNLLKNAVEAIEKTDNANELFILMIEYQNTLEIEVRNESPYIDPNNISTFFTKGYSEKGEGRGLGLYNVQNICNEYELQIYPENKEINGKNWLSFKITNKPPDAYT
ncbi:MAG: GHKL domain-containing protein [Lachnospiraceae bacterium]|nr:GHKL domain-containing protein [Lachnospiraceae bacterium]